jgi:tetratricopeptide (TPR) repeat protein
MKPSSRAQKDSAASRREATRDSFDRAAEALEAQRPVRHRDLKKIVASLLDNRFEAAEKDLTEYLARHPDDADALSLMARIAVRKGHPAEAVPLLERCLHAAPDFDAARLNYAGLLFQLNRYDAARAEINRLVARDPRNPLFRALKANILETIGEGEESLALCEQLAAENPDRAESWISYGHALRGLGIQDKSVAAYRKAIEQRPDSGAAYWSLANLKAVRFDAADIAAMQAQLNSPELRANDRTMLQFALGKAFEDMGAYERAFEQYAKANAAMRLRIDYDPDRLSSGVAANKALFTRAFFESRRDAGCAAPDPIFILGRPRSGSTLLEQILSSHSAVEGTAELSYITTMAARLEQREGSSYGTKYLARIAEMTPAELEGLGRQYLDSASVHRKRARPFFIDKKPGNFAHVGLILTILPNAKIIDARRNPAACGLSMFKHHSTKGRLRLAELGRFYRDYVELMAHFDAVLPGRIHRVIYEDMVADPESEVRKLLAYLGLPFEESCLRFYETKRAVLTPSSEQVRRPITGEAVDHWRNFEPWLGPLIKSLGTAFTEYPVVPAELR